MTKILLVEDDKSLREIYGVRLAAEGYEIVSVGDGEEALTVAIKERPDLIISDVMMPKISGFDMLDILRATPETKDLKVIMMTALSSDDQRARGESLGADRYLVKSQVGIEDVVRTVHEVLGDTPGATPAQAFNAPAAPATQEPAQEDAGTPPVVPADTPVPATPTDTPSLDTTPTAPAASPEAPAAPTVNTTPEPTPPAAPVAPEPYPRAIDTPAPEPTVISTPAPAPVEPAAPAQAEPATLPQPVAPFSSPAPASLGEQVAAAAQAAAANTPPIPTASDPTAAVAPVPVEPAAPATPPVIDTQTPQPAVPNPPAPATTPASTQPQPAMQTASPTGDNIADLISKELQDGTTTP